MNIQITQNIHEEISVFETLRSYGGKILGLEEHLERLKVSAKALKLPFTSRKEIARQILDELQKGGNPDLLIRPTIHRDGIRFFALPIPKIKQQFYEEGVTVKTSATRLPTVHAHPVGAKSNAYGPQTLTFLKPHFQTEFEILYLDSYGFVGEARITNIFLIKKKRLKTPPATHILNGVTRRLMLDLALRAGLEVEEIPLTRHDFYNADECFLTNSVIEVMPIRSIDGRLIQTGRPGEKTHSLRKLYQDRIKSL